MVFFFFEIFRNVLKTQREREIERSFILCLTPHMFSVARPGLGQDQELQLALPCVWQGSLDHLLLPCQVFKLELDWKWSSLETEWHHTGSQHHRQRSWWRPHLLCYKAGPFVLSFPPCFPIIFFI